MSVKSQQPAGARKQPAPVAGKAPAVDSTKRLRDLTEKIAYELYERRGRVDGRADDDWFAAETIARERIAGDRP